MNEFIFKNNETYKKAYKLLSEDNIFSILKIENDELKHTNIIEWLLKYNNYQGIKKILEYYFKIKIDNNKPFQAYFYNDKPFNSIFDNLKDNDKYRKRPDILIDIKYDETQYYLLIENKIFALENDYNGKKQTEEYFDIMQEVIEKKQLNKNNVKFIFLNTTGIEAQNKNYKNIDYNELYKNILNEISINKYDKRIYDDYIKCLKRPMISKDFDPNTIFLIDQEDEEEYFKFYKENKESILNYLEINEDIYDLDYITIKYIVSILNIKDKLSSDDIILKKLGLSKSKNSYYWTYNDNNYSNIKIIENLIIDMLRDKRDILNIFKDVKVGNDMFITNNLDKERKRDGWINYLSKHPEETIEDHYFNIGEEYYIRKLISKETMEEIQKIIKTNNLNDNYRIELYNKNINN